MPSLFDLARRINPRGGMGGIDQPQNTTYGTLGNTAGQGLDYGTAGTNTRTLGMPGNTAGPMQGVPGYGTNSSGKYSADGMFGTGGGAAKTNFGFGNMLGGSTSNMGNGGSWTNTNNPLSGGLLGKLPAFNQPTGWANGVDPKYMGAVTQGGTGGALPGAMNQWLNNPALKEAQQAFQAKMKADIQGQLQSQFAQAQGGIAGPGGMAPGAPPEWLVAQNQATQQFAQGLAGKSNQEIDAMYEALVQEASLNKNTPANQLTNQKMEALRKYGNAQGFDNWLTPEQRTQKMWANGSPW